MGRLGRSIGKVETLHWEGRDVPLIKWKVGMFH